MYTPNNDIVIGMQFGDEGKGRVVDYLCSQRSISNVIRFSGGHQAYHGVYIDEDLHHGFSNFGSGTFKGVPTYFSEFCTVDPVSMCNEYDILVEKNAVPYLFVDPKCPVVTPYDKVYNRVLDKKNRHGSCGVGFGTTLQREEDFYSLTFEDLFHPIVFKIKMNNIHNYYMHQKFYSLFDNFGQRFNDIKQRIQDDLEHFLDCVYRIKKENIARIGKVPYFKPYLNEGSCVFEGSQGLLLDQHMGFFPHVTRSDLTFKNIESILGKEVDHQFDLWLVTRAYQTRHGNGPMTNLNYDFPIKKNPYEINNDQTFQGKFRTSILDLDLLKYSLHKNEKIHNHLNKHLVITCLDLMEGYALTKDETYYEFSNECDFIWEIRNTLGISNISLSRGPYGDLEPF